MTWSKAWRGVSLVLGISLAGCVSVSTAPVHKADPHRAAEIETELGADYLEQGDDDRAMQRLQRALELDASLPSAHDYIAQLYEKLGQIAEADRHYQRALKLAPEDPQLLNDYGVFLCRQKHFAEAEKNFLAAAKQPLYHTPEAAYENAGLCTPDPAKKETYLRIALRFNPKMGSVLYDMAALKYQQSDFLSARAFLERYMDLGQASPQGLWLGVRVERQLGDRPAAERYGQQLLKTFPDSEESALFRENAP